ncbi:MAG: DUF1800 domain-containing protein [Planctomycetota bacterium]
MDRAKSRPASQVWRRHIVGVLVGLGVALTSGAIHAQVETPPLHRLFVRGDANADGAVNVGDPITTLGYLFAGALDSVPCLDAADANDDEAVNVADVVATLAFLFGSGPAPAAPTPFCGADPTTGYALACDHYGPCDAFVDVDTAAHVARRVGYGPTLYEYSRLLDPAIGIDGYLAEQLNPTSIDETTNDVLNLVLSILDPAVDPVFVLFQQVARPLFARRQLQENLTDFWENHFSTYLLKSNQVLLMLGEDGVSALTHALAWEDADNQHFRDQAIGTFHDLLVRSAESPAMLVYLDGILNIAQEPNENYARELLELHTLGVDNGYTQTDIEQVARCFTGWTICKKAPADVGDPLAPCVAPTDPAGVWSFHFEPSNHDYGAKTIFAGTINQIVRPAGDPAMAPADGLLDGYAVLEQLGRFSPQTAEFVSSKLIQKFVSEEVPNALLADCVATWIATQGNLTQVLGVIFAAPEFLAPEHRWNKVKTPMEHHVSMLRQSGMVSTGIPIVAGVGGQPNGLLGLGHTPFLRVTPDGYSEFGVDWIGTSSILHRLTFNNFVVHSTTDPLVDVITPMVNAGIDLSSARAVADFWMQLAYQSHRTEAELQLATRYLLQDVAGLEVPLDPTAPDYDFRVRSLVGFVFSGSQFHQQ